MVQVAGSGTVATDNAVEMATALPSGLRYSTPLKDSGTRDTVEISIEALGSENKIYPLKGGVGKTPKPLDRSGDPKVLVSVFTGATATPAESIKHNLVSDIDAGRRELVSMPKRWEV